jgi:hypothetical protein
MVFPKDSTLFGCRNFLFKKDFPLPDELLGKTLAAGGLREMIVVMDFFCSGGLILG